ncbi:MAG: hypothetical protein H8D94_01460 [Candidatus Pelagibacter sp.]|nr:hypothetical protein [Candidatus Pelagibacter sp.]
MDLVKLEQDIIKAHGKYQKVTETFIEENSVSWSSVVSDMKWGRVYPNGKKYTLKFDNKCNGEVVTRDDLTLTEVRKYIKFYL